MNCRNPGQFGSKRFRQIGHLTEFTGTSLVDPAKKLGGAKALLAQLLAESGKAVEIKIQKIRQATDPG